VALVGPLGSGKSTIGRLLFRFYDVVGRRDPHRRAGPARRHAGEPARAIGVVPQDTVLFNDTIRYNIAYGRPEATRAEIEARARRRRSTISSWACPRATTPPWASAGLKLSGGEKQRVGIARTLLKDPPILLLDEATSRSTPRPSALIQSELKMMGQGRTVITIAHRLSTIVDADRIVVLEAGGETWSSRAPMTTFCGAGFSARVVKGGRYAAPSRARAARDPAEDRPGPRPTRPAAPASEGVKTSVSTVAMPRPKTTAVASCFHHSAVGLSIV
jgi:ABC-type transport system involved in cytochrome bd biosynthesis fused ATPase/permease subunit